MWLLTLGLPIIVLIIVGSILLGGIWTIILVPLMVIVAVVAGIWTFGRAQRHRERIPGEREPIRPLPHTGHVNTPGGPSTPGDLVDARRGQQ